MAMSTRCSSRLNHPGPSALPDSLAPPALSLPPLHMSEEEPGFSSPSKLEGDLFDEIYWKPRQGKGKNKPEQRPKVRSPVQLLVTC